MRFDLSQTQCDSLQLIKTESDRLDKAAAEYKPVHTAAGNCGHKMEGEISVSHRESPASSGRAVALGDRLGGFPPVSPSRLIFCGRAIQRG